MTKRRTPTEVKSAVSVTMQRLIMAHGVERVTLEAGCETPKTITNARDAKSLIGVNFLFNLLSLDGSALDELAGAYGFKMVPLQITETSDNRLLADLTGLSAELADALADGHVDHVEEQRIANRARPVVRELAARVAVADRKRVA